MARLDGEERIGGVISSHGVRGSASGLGSQLRVRPQPNLAYKMFTALNKGDTVMVLPTITGVWAEARLPDGRTVFVVRQYLRQE